MSHFHDEGYVFGLHPPTLERMLQIGAPVYDRYFRVESEDIEHVPTDGPAILVANHGGVLPVDADVEIVLAVGHEPDMPSSDLPMPGLLMAPLYKLRRAVAVVRAPCRAEV